MGFGLTDAGLGTQTQAELVAQVYERFSLIWGDEVDEATESNIRQLVDALTEYMANYQQVTLGVYRSFDPAGARGAALDARRALTGSTRKPAYGSTVTLDLVFTGAGTVIDGDTFRLDNEGEDQTIWEVYGGPYSIGGAGTLEGVTARCQTTGPIPALADSTWAQDSAITNLDGDGISNDEDATLGGLVETDAAFRVRAQREIYAAGLGPLATIRAIVSRLEGVVSCRVYHNPRIAPADSDGIPFKAFNVVVRTQPDPPDATLEQEIWDAIFSCLGAGGEAYGTDHVGTATDSENEAHAVAFDLLADVPMHIRQVLTTSTSEVVTTTNLEAIVEAALLTAALTLHTVSGKDVAPMDFTGVTAALKAAGLITGVDEVTTEISDDGVTWQSTKYVIGIREIPAFSSSRISATQI